MPPAHRTMRQVRRRGRRAPFAMRPSSAPRVCCATCSRSGSSAKRQDTSSVPPTRSPCASSTATSATSSPTAHRVGGPCPSTFASYGGASRRLTRATCASCTTASSILTTACGSAPPRRSAPPRAERCAISTRLTSAYVATTASAAGNSCTRSCMPCTSKTRFSPRSISRATTCRGTLRRSTRRSFSTTSSFPSSCAS